MDAILRPISFRPQMSRKSTKKKWNVQIFFNVLMI